MPQRDKKTWPKSAHDAVDWEKLFEDAETGFIPAIAKAGSRDTLVKIATLIIQKLFDRAEDVEHLQAFAVHLKEAIDHDPQGHDLDHLQTTVITLFREIKETRKAEAEDYISRESEKDEEDKKPHKKRRKGDDERDDGPEDGPKDGESKDAKNDDKESPKKKKKRKKKLKKPKKPRKPKEEGSGFQIPTIIPKTALFLLALLAVGYFGYLIFDQFVVDEGTPEEQAAAVALVQKYVTDNRPSDQWEIASATFTEELKIAVKILIKDKRHLGIIASQSAMARRAFIHSLCPPQKGEFGSYVSRGWGIWIELTDGRTALTAGTCPYIGLNTN